MGMAKVRGRAFTLVEVLIVVSVIGVLAAVAVPGFARARLKGQEAHARMMLHQMRSAQMRIYNDTGCYAFPADMYRATPQMSCYRINLTTGAPMSGAAYPPGSWRGPYLSGPAPREDGIPFYIHSSIPGVIYVFDGHALAGQRGIYLHARTVGPFATDGTRYRDW
jgi:prepilin-type N-terminal cleavage/methylation domain-containing protein